MNSSARILVLGDSGVGKSSLINLICHSNVLTSVQWTIGCSIEVKLHDGNYLEFWDIGGSRTHKIARSFLYNDYHGIILVFDATNNKSRTNLAEWLSDVTQKNNDSSLVNLNVPIITIATKQDLLANGRPVRPLYKDRHLSSSSSRVVLQTYELSFDDDVIYVNTQDPQALSISSKNYDRLNCFFKQVLERRNKKFHNKFAI